MADVKLPELPEWALDNRHLRLSSSGLRGRVEAYARAAVELNRVVVDDDMVELALDAYYCHGFDWRDENLVSTPDDLKHDMRAALTAALLCPKCAKTKQVAPANETRNLGNGEKITQKQMLKELADLGPEWRLEKPHELYAQVEYGYKNQNGAYTRDETLKADVYWTDQETPCYRGGRVVVGFNGGDVYGVTGATRAFARAVRVSGMPQHCDDELTAARARIAELEKDAGRLDLWAHIDTIREAVCDAKAEAKANADLYQGYKRAELYVEWHEKYSELLRAIDAAMARDGGA